jgi:ParB/RepB/Spo0J family partition protein
VSRRLVLRGTGVTPRPEERELATRQIRAAGLGRPGVLVPVDQIVANPRNPRRTFDEQALNELAQSILTVGQLQPVVARRTGDVYELICGERRWRAAQRANLPEVWLVERAATDAEAYRIALAENLHRVGLSRVEKVAALDELGELAHSLGVRQTARELGMSPGWLVAQIQMRQDPVLFPALEGGHINFRQADALRRAPAALRQTLLDRTLRERADRDAILAWIGEARERERVDRASTSAVLAASDGRADPFEAALELLRQAGTPGSDLQRSAVREIAHLALRVLGVEPAPEMFAGGAGVDERGLAAAGIV